MNLRTLIDLKIDSVLRSPHVFQKFLLVLISLFYLFAVGSILLMLGLKMKMLLEIIGLSSNNSFSFYFSVVLLLASIDFLLKIVFLKNHFSFARLNYFPNTSKALKQYYYVKQLVSFLLFYIPFLLSYQIITSIVPEYGVFAASMCVVFAYSISLFNSQLVLYLKGRRISLPVLLVSSVLVCGVVYLLLYFSVIPTLPMILPILSVLFFLASIVFFPRNYRTVCYSIDQETRSADLFFRKVGFGQNRIHFYVILFLKMATRAPLLRKQILMMTALSFIYILMIKPVADPSAGVFMMEVIWPLVIFLFIPLSMSQLTFRAEGAFFDQLYMAPDIQNLLKARYIVGVLFSIIMVFLYCGIYYVRFGNIPAWSVFIPAWLLGVGPLLQLSFLSIFFSGPRLDLFDTSWSNSSQNSSKIQYFFLTALISFILLLCYLLFEYTSQSAALWTMAIVGGMSLMLSFKYFDFIFKLYYQRRYKQMEGYRVK